MGLNSCKCIQRQEETDLSNEALESSRTPQTGIQNNLSSLERPLEKPKCIERNEEIDSSNEDIWEAFESSRTPETGIQNNLSSLERPLEKPKKDYSGFPVDGVYFTSVLFEEKLLLSKEKLREKVKSHLLNQSKTNPSDLCSAIRLLYAFNSEHRCEEVVETIKNLLSKIIEFPNEKRYRQIRMKNPKVEEKILAIRGCLEILLALGFEEIQDGDPFEKCLFLSKSKSIDIEKLLADWRKIVKEEPLLLKLARDTKTFQIPAGYKLVCSELPSDFEENREKVEEIEKKFDALRTKKMKEMDKVLLKCHKYKYSLVRIELPDHFVLQGTFDVYEPVESIREWAKEYLVFDQFVLKNENRLLNYEETIGEAKMAPYCLMNLEWIGEYDGPSLKEIIERFE